MKSSKAQWLVSLSVLLAFAGLLLFWGRCELANKKAAYARLRIINYAETGWRIEFLETGSGRRREVHVPRNGEVKLPIPPGAYVMTQVLLDDQDVDVASRVLNAEIAAKGSYVFRLVTLESAVEEATGVAR